ncbi:MAG: hypothetical protein IEMM0008_1380 [bacterium]|nr:MAG: hypothetical protein IEMM0008_1380 [bacterium]
MFNQLKSYFRKESGKNKISFLPHKIILLVAIIGIGLWNSLIRYEKPTIYWILFSIVMIYGLIILFFSYKGRGNKTD